MIFPLVRNELYLRALLVDSLIRRGGLRGRCAR